jgi:hypothetical protein
VVVILLAVLAVLLILPFLNPNVHLVCLPVTYRDLSVPPIAYAQDDIAAFLPLEDRLYSDDDHPVPDIWTNLKNSVAMKGLGGELSGLVRKSEVLIFYLNAHGVSDDGAAYLLCSDFDSTKRNVGRYELAELLAQLKDCPGKLKLVVLDSGRIAGDARLGMTFNEFPLLLEQAVKECDDYNLWVLSANSALETSHIWPTEKRSVFGYYVAEGLKGDADADGNKKIDLDELFSFVSANVSGWVSKYGDGETQTPQLLRGGVGRTRPRERLVLMPVPRKTPVAKRETKEAEPAEKSPEKQTGGVPSAAAMPIRGLFPSRTIGLIATRPQDATPAAKSSEAPPAPQESKKSQDSPGKESTTAQPPVAPTDAEKKKTTESPPPETAAAPLAVASGDVRGLLEQAWQLRDAMEARRPNQWSPTPIDYAPHLWREFQELLLGYEAAYRYGAADSSRDLGKLCEESVLTLKGLSEGKRLTQGRGRSHIAERLSIARPAVLAELADPRSLTLAGLVAAAGDPARYKELRQLAVALDATSRSLTPDDFRTWIKQIRQRDAQLVELNLARRLEPSVDARNWDVVRLAIQTSHIGELAASYSDWCKPWVHEAIESADRDRLAGEQELAAGYREAEQRAAVKLQQAKSKYEKALDDIRIVGEATQSKNDLMFRAPYYVRWFALANLDHASVVPTYGDLVQLLEGLQKLIVALDAPGTRSVTGIMEQKKALDALRNQIETPLRKEAVDSIVRLAEDDPAAKGLARRIDDLLATPLLAGPLRARLIEAVGRLDPHAFEFRVERITAPPASSAGFSTEQRKRIHQVAQLEMLLVRLAGKLPFEETAQPSDPAVAFQKLAAIRAPESAGTQPDDELRWDYREFGGSLKSFYQSLPRLIEDESNRTGELRNPDTRGARMAALAAVERALRLVDARDALSVDAANPVETLRRANLYDLLVWHRQRYETASTASDAEADSRYFASCAEAYRNQANTLLGPELTLADTGAKVRLVLDGRRSVQLYGMESQPLDVSVQVAGQPAAKGPATVAIKFDPSLVEIRRTSDNLKIDPQAELPWPSFAIKPESKGTLQYRVVARPAPTVAETKVIVRVTVDSVTFPHETIVALPVPDPVDVVAVPVLGWARLGEGRGAVLAPFPNKTTDYRFDLFNSSEKVETITKVEVLAVPNPAAGEPRLQDLPFSRDGKLLPGFDPPRQLAVMDLGDKAIVLQPKEQVPIPFMEFKPDESVELPSAKHGLIWVITNDKGRKSIKRMDVSPLRPKTYLQPEVGYDRETARITIAVRQREGSAIPKDGCTVRCEIEPRDLKTGKKKLDDDVVGPRFEANLWLQVDPNPKTDVTLKIFVDDYPRAFVYRVNCGETRSNIPAVDDLRAISVLAPANDQAYRAPTDTIPVRFEVDARDDSFDQDTNFIEVGIDENRDRELAKENALRFFNNRQSDVLIKSVTTAGIIRLATKVDDFTVELPSQGLSNARVGVLGMLHLDGDIVLSRPLDILLDETPPTISDIRAEANELGKPVRVSARVADDESDVDFVEFGFDPEGKGELAKQPPPLRGLQDKSAPGTWKASLPTDGLTDGTCTLLVRATNKVGIATKFEPIEVSITAPPKPPAPDGPEKTTSTVTGRLVLNDDPMPGIKVTLLGANEFTRETQTNPRGEFRFEKIPAGKYRLQTKTIAKNKERTASADVEVIPPKPAAKDLKLQ